MKQSFNDKFFGFVFILLSLKLVSIIVMAVFYHSRIDSILNMFVIFIFAALLFLAISKMIAPSAFRDSGSSDSLLESEAFDKLRQKYQEMAEKFERENQHFKAAGVYMKLLQDNYEAACVLKRGNYYNEAAIIYLKKLDDKNSAASCYELGKNYTKSIQLYLELKNYEKVGDLYKQINDREKANHYFSIIIENLLKNSQYVKASLVYRYKIEDNNNAQNILMKGWKDNNDSYNCLNNYFANISNETVLKNEIQTIYQQTTNFNKRETFLQVIKLEYEKYPTLRSSIKKIAYSIISERILLKKEIAHEIKFFNKEDKMIDKDISRCKASSKRMFN